MWYIILIILLLTLTYALGRKFLSYRKLSDEFLLLAGDVENLTAENVALRESLTDSHAECEDALNNLEFVLDNDLENNSGADSVAVEIGRDGVQYIFRHARGGEVNENYLAGSKS